LWKLKIGYEINIVDTFNKEGINGVKYVPDVDLTCSKYLLNATLEPKNLS
jgi:hypothetical protein